MAYDWGQREESVAKAASTASAAVIGHYCPTFFPIVLRAVSMVVTTAIDDSGTLTIKKYPTAGSSASAETIDTLAFGALAQGSVLYLEGLDTKILPGEELVFEITATGASGVFDLGMVIDESRERPGNNADMVATA